MPTEVSMEIVPDELEKIVEAVFASMIELEVSPCDQKWFPRSDCLTAAVHLAGDWNGAVLLECEPEQACRWAARFLSIDPPATVNDIVRDVLGELTNIIGGNLKCMLAHEIRLSMPAVVAGNDYSIRVCGSEVRERLGFQCAEGVFWIIVLAARS